VVPPPPRSSSQPATKTRGAPFAATPTLPTSTPTRPLPTIGFAHRKQDIRYLKTSSRAAIMRQPRWHPVAPLRPDDNDRVRPTYSIRRRANPRCVKLEAKGFGTTWMDRPDTAPLVEPGQDLGRIRRTTKSQSMVASSVDRGRRSSQSGQRPSQICGTRSTATAQRDDGQQAIAAA